MVTAAMKLKDIDPWKKSYDQPRQHIKKQKEMFLWNSLAFSMIQQMLAVIYSHRFYCKKEEGNDHCGKLC